ncbi:MAG: TlpA disulfide reductase family protein [Vulcanimicrobiaceae bacterium]
MVFGFVMVALAVVVLTFKSYFGAAGGPAASYAIKTLDGADDSLERYRGRIVLVNLWASWCAPCRSETPALERLFEENRTRGLVVLGIDQGESEAAASTFAREMRLTYPILLDEQQQYGRAYAAIGLPTSLVVDRTGHIVRGIDGELTLAQMREAVAPLLARRPR